MPIAAIFLLLASAALHTTWNALLKALHEKYIAAWWIIASGGFLSLLGLLLIGLPKFEHWPFVLASVCAEVAYFWVLARGYSQYDFSIVYPVARGAAPGITAAWALLFMGERASAGGIAGLVLVLAGLLVIGAERRRGADSDGVSVSGLIAGLLVALLVSTYTIIDGTAVRRGAVAPYALTVFALMPLPAAPIVIRRYGWRTLGQAFAAERSRFLLISLLGIASYLLALTAYQLAPLSYSAAIRESSVVMGALVGWRYFGEKMGRARLAGALVVFAGFLLIGLTA